MNERTAGLEVAGARLRKWREGQGLTQVAAAARIQSTQGAWNAWEHGDRAPDLYFALELERLTEHAIDAEAWAFPRSTSRAAADETGPHPVADLTRTG